MYKRFEKFLFSSATVFALCLSVRELLIALDEPRGLGFLCGALTWLLLSAAQLQDALVAFEDRLQRRLVSIPLALSTFFGFGAVVIGSFSDSLWTTFAALLLLMACALVYRKFTAVRASYDTVGSGYLAGTFGSTLRLTLSRTARSSSRTVAWRVARRIASGTPSWS